MINQIILSIILILYAILVSFITKKTFDFMVLRNIEKIDAIYYNRKLVHILAGGIIALFVPLFNTPLFPLFSGIILAVFTFFSHRKGEMLYWFQNKRDFNDVSFCLMWGFTVYILWSLIGNPWIAIIPVTFMAFGDGITGIVRNAMFKQRTKHPLGNLYMFGICAPIGFIFAQISGIEGMLIWAVIAAAVASIVERYEFRFIDDNILISIFSSIVLYIGFLFNSISF
jgi:dolichol kinase